jgi:DNA-binding IscR family transcriptional regulator
MVGRAIAEEISAEEIAKQWKLSREELDTFRGLFELALDARAYRRPCVINAAMLRAESAWRAELERTSLADIVSGVVATADPRVMARSAGWLECNGRPAQRA